MRVLKQLSGRILNFLKIIMSSFLGFSRSQWCKNETIKEQCGICQ